MVNHFVMCCSIVSTRDDKIVFTNNKNERMGTQGKHFFHRSVRAHELLDHSLIAYIRSNEGMQVKLFGLLQFDCDWRWCDCDSKFRLKCECLCVSNFAIDQSRIYMPSANPTCVCVTNVPICGLPFVCANVSNARTGVRLSIYSYAFRYI